MYMRILLGTIARPMSNISRKSAKSMMPNMVFGIWCWAGFKLGDAGKRFKQFNFNDFVSVGLN